jgi:hypothetical protein
MTDSPRQPVEPPSSTGFGTLAERIAAWTTRLLLTVMVLVAGVAVARQVTIWWREDPGVVGVVPTPALPDDLGDPLASHILQFGDSPWGMERQTIEGPAAAAFKALRESCRRCLDRDPVAPEGLQKSEQSLLASLGRRPPVDQRPGRWRLYDLEGGFPVVVGVSQQGGPPPRLAGNPVAGTTGRMVTWGMGIPTGDRSWALYTFSPSASADVGQGARVEVPLPPHTRCMLAIRVSGGGGMKTFRGVGRNEPWTHFYDQWFGQQGWTSAMAWQHRGATWRARYTHANPATVVDVQWTADDRGESTGLILVSPSQHRTEGR